MANLKVLPTEEMYKEWLAHPVSQSYRQLLHQWRQGLMEQWAAGRFQVDGDPLKIAVANAGALGEAGILEKLSELDYDQFSEGFDDDEYIRVTPPGSLRPGEAV